MKLLAPAVPAVCIVFVLAAGGVSARTTVTQASASQPARSSPQSSGTAEQQIRSAHQQLLAAVRSNDKETARRLMDDNMTWVNVEGSLAGRDETIEAAMTPPTEVSIERVRTLGDTAIVAGSAEFSDGRQVRFLQEWVNRGGQWRLFAHQGTMVAPEEEPGEEPPTPAVGTAGRSAMRSSAPVLNSDAERAVWKAQMDLQRAYLGGDVAAYAKLTSDDYFRIDPSGKELGKSEFLQTVKGNASQSKGQLDTGDVQIAVTGDTARVVMNMWGTQPNGDAIPLSRVTRVWVKRNGQWQQTAVIFTAVAQQ